MGERQSALLRGDLDRQLKLTCPGARATNDAGLHADRELAEALKLATAAARDGRVA